MAIFLLLTDGVAAQGALLNEAVPLDSMEISLLTCGARQKVYGLYGHTAVRVRDKYNGMDVVVNYGMFSFDKPFFVLRFVFGLTDYEMGIEDFDSFLRHYMAYGTEVRQQTLNLTRSEKAAICKAFLKNYELQNRVYRYNYFYDNCTTRARDILVGNIDGTVRYGERGGEELTYRQMIHAYNADHRWARFGNDLLLGVGSDMPTTREQQQFLPDNLRKCFDSAVVVDKAGGKRSLVAKTSWLLSKGVQEDMGSFPLSPTECGVVFMVLVVGASVYERLRRRTYWGVDLAVMLITGLCGLILFSMIFSVHPTVRVNLQILLLNPLTLVFLYPSIKRLRQGKLHPWILAWMVCIVAFLFGGFFQSYAEGMYFVASSLLLRYILKTDQMLRSAR